jgi:hypothetical protein
MSKAKTERLPVEAAWSWLALATIVREAKKS